MNPDLIRQKLSEILLNNTLFKVEENQEGDLVYKLNEKGEKIQICEIKELEWEEKDYSEIFINISPIVKIQKQEMLVEGIFPVVSQSEGIINGFTDIEDGFINANKKNPVLLFGDHTTLIKYIDFNFFAGADGTKLMYINKDFFPKYIYFKSINRINPKGYERHFQYFKKIKFQIPTPYKNYSSYQLQQSIVKNIEEKMDALNYRGKVVESMEKLLELEKEKYLESIWKPEKENSKILFEVEENQEGELVYKLDEKGERIQICEIKELEWEEKEIKSFATLKGGNSNYTADYIQDSNNSGDFLLMTGSKEIASYINPIDDSDIIKEESVSFNKDNDAGSKAFYHNKPYIIGGHHYGIFIKDHYKENIVVKYLYYCMDLIFLKNMFYQSRQPVANKGRIEQFKIAIPMKNKTHSSYQLQQSIVKNIEEKIGSLLFKIENLYKIKEIIEMFKEKVLESLRGA